MALPPGFVVDKLPEGFAVDQPEQNPADITPPQGGFGLPAFGAPPTQADPRQLVAMGATSQETLDERERALAALTPERRTVIESINPAEAALIGAGRGLTTLGRAIGIAEPETPLKRHLKDELLKTLGLSNLSQ
jgi:hypothetical protein